MRLFRRSKVSGQRTRVLFATDLHGSDLVYRKFLNAIGVYEADIAILGGDLTGKSIVPVLEGPEGYSAEVRGVKEVAHDDEELERVLGRIRDTGQYPVVLTPAEHDRLLADPQAVDAEFVKACHAQVKDWMERSAERLEPVGVPMFVTGGNDDYLSIEGILNDAPYITNAEGKVIEVIPGVEMISTGYANLTPWKCPRDIPDEELGAKIEEMAEHLSNPHHSIFNLHVPPYGSGLDVCPKLDTSVDPPRPLAGETAPAGSEAVSAAISLHGPMLSLHGHIHESSGIQTLGETTVINPGSEYAQGVLRSAAIDLFDSSMGSAQLLTA